MEFLSSFDWRVANFNSPWIAFSVPGVYVSIILLHKLIFGQSPPGFGELQLVQAGHNLILCIGSLVIFTFVLYELYARSVLDHDITWIVCEKKGTLARGSLWFWSYVYYLSKYYELFDTVLQLLRGKVPPHYFLHVYHHALIIVMCWFWLEFASSLQFIGILFNTLVHVVMYAYFFLRSINRPPSWKKYVTRFQIVQFVTSFLCFGCTLYHVYFLNQNCNGMNTVYLQLLFNGTLLYGFVGLLSGEKGSRSFKKDFKQR